MCVLCGYIYAVRVQYDSTRNVTVQLVRTVIGAGKGTKKGGVLLPAVCTVYSIVQYHRYRIILYRNIYLGNFPTVDYIVQRTAW